MTKINWTDTRIRETCLLWVRQIMNPRLIVFRGCRRASINTYFFDKVCWSPTAVSIKYIYLPTDNCDTRNLIKTRFVSPTVYLQKFVVETIREGTSTAKTKMCRNTCIFTFVLSSAQIVFCYLLPKVYHSNCGCF